MVISTAILGVLALLTIMTIDGRMNRSMELKSSLSSVVEETIENMTADPKYSIENKSEFLSDLAEALVMTVDAVSDVNTKILKCDKDRNLMAVKVTLSYTHPNGNPGSISFEKVAIFNKKEQNEKQKRRVTFYVGQEIHKEYIVLDGSILTPPQNPVLLSGTFLGWVKMDGSEADFTNPVTEDLVYFASIG